MGKGLKLPEICAGLRKLTSRKRGCFSASPQNSEERRSQGLERFNRLEIAQLRQRWDQQRCDLLSKSRVDGDAVVDSLHASNVLMRDAPGSKLRTMARLSTTRDDVHLGKPDTVTYAICGPHLTCSGQCGAITGPRATIDRFRKHHGKGKYIKNHYGNKRGRAYFCKIKIGLKPSPAKVFARHGSHTCTMYPLERMAKERVGKRERH